jgi:hypothetical protein
MASLSRAICATLSIAALLLCTSAEAQSLHNAPRGTKVAGNFELGAVVIPLPEGDWILAGRGETEGREATGAVRIANVYVVELVNNQLARVVWAAAPLRGQGTGTGWVRNKNVCDRTNVLFNESDRNYNARDSSCWSVNHYVISTPNNPSPPLADFYDWLASNKLAIPRIRLVTEHWLTAAGPYVNVSYSFNPEIIGLDPGPADRWDSANWNTTQINAFPEKKAFADKIKDFGMAMHQQLARGLNARLEKGVPTSIQVSGWPVPR